MSWYERRIFDPMLDRGLDTEEMRGERSALLQSAAGRVLEIGPGTGLNFPHYPQATRHLLTVSPDATLATRALQRAEQHELQLEHLTSTGSSLPIDDESVDTVVATLVLCTVPEPRELLDEVRRVLAPNGKLLVFEHVLADSALHAGLQHFATPFSRVFACGCRPNRRTRETIEAAGFEWSELHERRTSALPRLVRTVVFGSARVVR
jgi:ubiquinone/menaquinone biosynthesis C-methylase UbiE